MRVINRLCRELLATRLRYAHLVAAARATLAAARDGEPDALDYLADELATHHDPHGHTPRWWAEICRTGQVQR